jgi:hypothetical protein
MKKMAQTSPRPWRMLLPLVALVLLFAAWSGYWWIADGYAQKAAAEQRARLAGHGLTLACDRESWGGYPFRFEFNCRAPRLVLQDHGSLAAAHVLAVAQAYDPTHMVLLVDGPTMAAAPGFAPVTILHGRAMISLRIIGTSDAEISADVPDVKIEGLVSAADVQLFSRPGLVPGTIDVAARLSQVKAALPGRPPLAFDSAQVIATLDRPLHATVSDISAALGTTRVWTSGDAGLDAEHRPAGKLTVATNDVKGLMAILDPQLALNEQQRTAFNLMLAFLGKEAKTTVTARDGQLSVGPVKLADLAPLF